MGKTKIVMVNFILDEKHNLQQCIIDYNDTGLPSDMKLIEGISRAVITNVEMEKLGDEARKILLK